MEKALLLRGVTVIDPASPAHGTTLDIRCAGGRIEAMAPQLSDAGAEVWDVPGSFASPGWVDGQAHFRDPGHEPKEGLESGLAAATAGGFSDVVLLPSSQPALGAGEAAIGPTVAAIANALADALGVRVRDLPLTRERIVAAIEEAPA